MSTKKEKNRHEDTRNVTAEQHREMCYPVGDPPQYKGMHNGEKRGKPLQPHDKDGNLLPPAAPNRKSAAKLARRLQGFTDDALGKMLSQKWRENMEKCKPGSQNRRRHG